MTDEKKYRRRLALIGILGAVAVALGALGAHFLQAQAEKGILTARSMAGFETAVRYHLFHTLAMLAVLVVRRQMERSAPAEGSSGVKPLAFAFNLFLAGIVLFSGSLYLLCTRELTGLEGMRMLGPVTPVGGVLFIAGWISLCVPLFSRR